MTTKCVIYRRYSSDEQGKGQGETLETQLEACKAYAARKGWQVVEILTDEGFSAFKGEHLMPGADLYEFVERVKAGAVEKGTILLAWKQSRVSRLEVDETMVWIYGLTSRGIGIAFSDSEELYEANPSMEKYLGMAMRAATANRESQDKSDNVIKAKLRMWDRAERREGKWVRLAVRWPHWLERNSTFDGWIINEHRAAIVRMVFEWSADGLGAPKIVQRLNAMKEPPWGFWHKKDDLTWGRSAVRQLLANPAVEGDLVPAEGILKGRVMHGFYPRIVDADLVAKARAAQNPRRKTKGARASTGSTNLFGGLTTCGECGRPASLSSNEKKGRMYRYLRCEGAGDGRKCDNTDYYPYGAFEVAALDLCIDLALDDRFFEASGELRESRIREAELEKLIGERKARRGKLMAAFDVDDEQAVEMIAALRTEIAGLQAQLAEIKADIGRASGKVSAVDHLRRVNDIRAAAMSENTSEREQARSKLRLAFGAILNGVSVERSAAGEKVFTLSFLGGVLGAQFDTRGRLIGTVTEALGQPLWEFLAPESRAALEPLIRRIQATSRLPKERATNAVR